MGDDELERLRVKANEIMEKDYGNVAILAAIIVRLIGHIRGVN